MTAETRATQKLQPCREKRDCVHVSHFSLFGVEAHETQAEKCILWTRTCLARLSPEVPTLSRLLLRNLFYSKRDRGGPRSVSCSWASGWSMEECGWCREDVFRTYVDVSWHEMIVRWWVDPSLFTNSVGKDKLLSPSKVKAAPMHGSTE